LRYHFYWAAEAQEIPMRTVDRSLEITALGLGQAGGRIASEFARRGYRALALDNAKADLDALGAGANALPDAQRIYIGVEGSDGASSDDYGRECIAAHAERIRAAVAEHAAAPTSWSWRRDSARASARSRPISSRCCASRGFPSSCSRRCRTTTRAASRR
jgi:hypothetical protein